jgi:integrase
MKGLYHQKGSLNYWFRVRINGKQYRFPTGESNEAEAIKAAQRIKKNPPITPTDKLTNEIEAFCGPRSSNYKRDSQLVLKAFARAMNGATVAEITPAKIKTWLDSLEVKPNTREAYRFQIQKFFDTLAAAGKVRFNPAREITIETEARSTRKTWIHKKHYPAIFQACTDLELKFALHCGFYAGLRKEEVIMCRPEWIDRQTGEYGVLHVTFAADWQPKDGTERTIPLAPEFREFLDNGFPRLPGPFMIAPFKTKKESDRYRVDFRTKFENFVINAELGHFTFHDTRRSFASNLVSAGVSLYKVAKWLGDDPDVVSRTYGHLSPDDADLALAFGGGQSKIIKLETVKNKGA